MAVDREEFSNRVAVDRVLRDNRARAVPVNDVDDLATGARHDRYAWGLAVRIDPRWIQPCAHLPYRSERYEPASTGLIQPLSDGKSDAWAFAG